jgi:hypothetical protein
MTRRWKLAAIGILTVAATSWASTLTTAYLMRPPAPAAPVVEPEPSPEPEARAPIVRVAPAQHGVGPARKKPSVTQAEHSSGVAP